MYTLWINKTVGSNVFKLFTPLIKRSVARKQFLISYYIIWTLFLCQLVSFLGFQTYKRSFFRFCWSHSTKNCANICCSGLENLLKIVEEWSSTFHDFYIDSERLFNAKLKIWDFANTSFADYQNLSFDDLNYYLEMAKKMSVCFRFVFVYLAFLPVLVTFSNNVLVLKFHCLLGDQNFSLVPQNVLKTANLVSMTKSSAENDRNFSTKFVAATFENNIAEILLE